MSAVEERLRAVVEEAAPRLSAFDDAAASRVPAPGAWSAKQVIGHLIDSANQNHARFVTAQLVDHLVFEGYEQEAWVELQRYQGAEWASLVELWRAYNLHLAHLIAAIPSEVRDAPRTHHELHRIAWKLVPAGEPTSLGYFIEDYVGHLEHHLTQAFHALRASD